MLAPTVFRPSNTRSTTIRTMQVQSNLCSLQLNVPTAAGNAVAKTVSTKITVENNSKQQYIQAILLRKPSTISHLTQLLVSTFRTEAAVFIYRTISDYSPLLNNQAIYPAYCAQITIDNSPQSSSSADKRKPQTNHHRRRNV